MAERTQRKMVDIEVVETSGVDHPAHLHEGWVVMKNAGAETVESLFGALNTKKEVTPMAADQPTTPSKEEYDALVAKAAKLEAENAELLAKAAAPADPQEELLKSVPESVRVMLAKAAADADEARAEVAKAREDVAKEREARLDAAAIVESRSMFKALAFDHATVAPALRKFADADPDTAKAIAEVLKAAEGQLESAGIFQELGKSADQVEKSATAKIEEAATALRTADPTLTPSTAFAKALEADPALYAEYLEGK